MRYVLSEQSARKFRELIGGTSGTASSRADGAGISIGDSTPAPLTVEYSATAGGTLGQQSPAWIIYTDGETVAGATTFHGWNSAIGWPTGWYVLPNDVQEFIADHSSIAVRISVRVVSNKLVATATYGNAGNGWTPVADVKRDADTGEVTIKQYVRSFVHASAPSAKRMFEPTFDTAGHITAISNGYIKWGRRYLHVVNISTSSISQETRSVVGLIVTHPTSYSASPSISFAKLTSYDWSNPPDGITYLPFYEFNGGEIVEDYRELLEIPAYS